MLFAAQQLAPSLYPNWATNCRTGALRKATQVYSFALSADNHTSSWRAEDTVRDFVVLRLLFVRPSAKAYDSTPTTFTWRNGLATLACAHLWAYRDLADARATVTNSSVSFVAPSEPMASSGHRRDF